MFYGDDAHHHYQCAIIRALEIKLEFFSSAARSRSEFTQHASDDFNFQNVENFVDRDDPDFIHSPLPPENDNNFLVINIMDLSSLLCHVIHQLYTNDFFSQLSNHERDYFSRVFTKITDLKEWLVYALDSTRITFNGPGANYLEECRQLFQWLPFNSESNFSSEELHRRFLLPGNIERIIGKNQLQSDALQVLILEPNSSPTGAEINTKTLIELTQAFVSSQSREPNTLRQAYKLLEILVHLAGVLGEIIKQGRHSIADANRFFREIQAVICIIVRSKTWVLHYLDLIIAEKIAGDDQDVNYFQQLAKFLGQLSKHQLTLTGSTILVQAEFSETTAHLAALIGDKNNKTLFDLNLSQTVLHRFTDFFNDLFSIYGIYLNILTSVSSDESVATVSNKLLRKNIGQKDFYRLALANHETIRIAARNTIGLQQSPPINPTLFAELLRKIHSLQFHKTGFLFLVDELRYMLNTRFEPTRYQYLKDLFNYVSQFSSDQSHLFEMSDNDVINLNSTFLKLLLRFMNSMNISPVPIDLSKLLNQLKVVIQNPNEVNENLLATLFYLYQNRSAFDAGLVRMNVPAESLSSLSQFFSYLFAMDNASISQAEAYSASTEDEETGDNNASSTFNILEIKIRNKIYTMSGINPSGINPAFIDRMAPLDSIVMPKFIIPIIDKKILDQRIQELRVDLESQRSRLETRREHWKQIVLTVVSRVWSAYPDYLNIGLSTASPFIIAAGMSYVYRNGTSVDPLWPELAGIAMMLGTLARIFEKNIIWNDAKVQSWGLLRFPIYFLDSLIRLPIVFYNALITPACNFFIFLATVSAAIVYYDIMDTDKPLEVFGEYLNTHPIWIYFLLGVASVVMALGMLNFNRVLAWPTEIHQWLQNNFYWSTSLIQNVSRIENFFSLKKFRFGVIYPLVFLGSLMTLCTFAGAFLGLGEGIRKWYGVFHIFKIAEYSKEALITAGVSLVLAAVLMAIAIFSSMNQLLKGIKHLFFLSYKHFISQPDGIFNNTMAKLSELILNFLRIISPFGEFTFNALGGIVDASSMVGVALGISQNIYSDYKAKLTDTGYVYRVCAYTGVMLFLPLIPLAIHLSSAIFQAHKQVQLANQNNLSSRDEIGSCSNWLMPLLKLGLFIQYCGHMVKTLLKMFTTPKEETNPYQFFKSSSGENTSTLDDGKDSSQQSEYSLLRLNN